MKQNIFLVVLVMVSAMACNTKEKTDVTFSTSGVVVGTISCLDINIQGKGITSLPTPKILS